jgi:hypothetical protein
VIDTESEEPCPACGQTPCVAAASRIPDGQRCVLGHYRDPCRPRRAVPGLQVCLGHRVRLLRLLRHLAALDRILAARATAGGSGPRAGARSADMPIPVADKAADMRRHVRRKLAGWVHIVAAGRRILIPGQSLAHALAEERAQLRHHRALLADADDPVTEAQAAALYASARTLARLADRITRLEQATDTAALVAWLLRHADWLLADPRAAADLAAEFAELHSAAWAQAYPGGEGRVPVGRCPLRTTCDVATREEQQCPGTVVGTVRRGDDLLPKELVCTACGAATPPRGWITLGRLLGGPATTRWLSAADLAELWDVPVKTVHRWSRWHRWPSDGGRPARYDAEKAQLTYDHYRGDSDDPPGVSQPAALTQVNGVSQYAS